MTFRTDEPELDAIDLELHALGGLDPARRALVEQAKTGPLAEEAAELNLAREVFARRARALPSQRWRWMASVAGLAVAAAGVAYLGVTSDDGLRTMGGAPAAFTVTVIEGPRPATFFLDVTPDATGFLQVATLQDDGEVSVLVSGTSVVAVPGETTRIDGLVRMDEYGGREWLVVTQSAEPVDAEHVRSRVQALLPSHAGSGDVFIWEVKRP